MATIMSESNKMHTRSLTKLTALKVSIDMWAYIEANGVSKSEALEALGMVGSDYLSHCSCCEYVYQQGDWDCVNLPCKKHCPAWLEFSATENSRLDDDDYPCVRNPNSPYYRYTKMHPPSLESSIYKQVGHDMVKLLKEAFERNLNESRLNPTEPLLPTVK